MTNTPNPDNQPEPNPNPAVKRFPWRRLWIAFGVIFLLIVAGGTTAGWIFVQRFLAPMVEKNVAKLLNRPLNMGKVERFSLNSLRFGASKLPATATDSDRGTADGVEVAYNPVKLLFNHKLELDVTLVNPNVYIEQDKDGRWVATEIQNLPEGALKINLQFFRLRQGNVVLVGRRENGKLNPPVTVALSGGNSEFLDNNKRILFDGSGKVGKDGKFSVKGEYLAPKKDDAPDRDAQAGENISYTKLQLNGTNINAVELGRLVALPLDLQGGKVGGNLEVVFEPTKPLQLLGVATLSQVTARVPALPQAFAKTNGILRFKGTQVRLEKVKTQFGEIPAEANGVLDTQTNFNLLARTEPITPKQVLQTFNIKTAPPVPITGMVQAAIRVTGALAKPIVSGEFITTKTTQVDRVSFRAISGGFKLDTSKVVAGLPLLEINNLRAIPILGGVVTGAGVVQLGEKGGLRFDVFGDNLPGAAIANIYKISLPFPIGLVSGKAQFFGPLDNPRQLRATGSARFNLAGGTINATNVQFFNPWLSAQVQATGVQLERLIQVPPNFKGPLTGKFTVAVNFDRPGLSGIASRGAGSLNLAGGTINANDIALLRGRWQTNVAAKGIELGKLFPQIPSLLQIPVNGNFYLTGPVDKFSLSQVSGRGSGNLNLAGGSVTAGDIQINGGGWRAIIRAVGIQLEKLIPSSPFPIPHSPFTGTFNTSGSLTEFSSAAIQVSGGGEIQVGGGVVRISEVKVDRGRFSTNIQANGVELAGLVPQLPPQFAGSIAGKFNLAGNLANLSPAAITGSGSGSLNIGGSIVKVSNLQLADSRFRANIQTDGINLAGLVPQLPPQFAGSIAGKFNLAGNLANLSPSGITGSGSGTVNIGDGRINLLDIHLADSRFRANIQTDGVNLAGLVPQLPPQFAGSIAGKFNLTGNLANLSPAGITGSGSGTVNIAGGTIAATNIQLNNGNFQATVAPENIQLQRFSDQLRGILDGAINIMGNLANLSPTAITQSLRVDGKLNFSEGIPGINGPLTTAFRWKGDGIEIQQATGPGLSASGFVGINLNRGISPNAITNFNLDIAAKDLNLQQISNYLPPTAANLKVVGNLDFDGKIEGTIAAPNVRGDLELKNFIINDIAFEPLLKGGVNTVSGAGLQLNLKGENDRIEVALGKDYLPISFNIRQGSAMASPAFAIAQGTRKQDNLQVTAQNFPIGIIQKVATLPAAFATQPLTGDISGNLDINLKTFDIAVNNLAIAGSIFDRTRGDETKPGNNQYIITGKLTSRPQGPQFQGKVDVIEGQLPVLVALWQLFDVTKANPRFPTPPEIAQVGLPESPLQTQLRRFSEITALLAQTKAKRKETSPLPELTEIDGIFTGSLNIAASLASGINAEFDIQGKDWKWGAFQTSQVIAKGSFKDSVLTLLPVRVESGDSIATFSGTIGGETQSGKLQLENVPIALIREFVNLPPAIGFGGKINGSATLAGNLANPQARGELTVVDASLNQEKVQSVAGSFSYNNARLNFAADSILETNSDPITITGSIPYKLPFPDAISPDNNKLYLDINVKDKGLAILDILSRQQIIWLDGKGDVNVKIEGIFDQEKGRPTDLIAKGTATVSDAKIAAQTLPEPLTNVVGEIQFNFDQIDVKSLSGDFGGGQVTASGTLPISEAVPQTNPLTVNIPDLALNLKGLYSGAVKGNITLAGAALAPVLTGKLELFNGKIPLPDEASSAVSVSAESDPSIPVEFNNLEITLGKDIQIRQAPILNFLAEGILTINGSLNNMKPKGEIDLRRGQVNIFTTQFRLAGGYNNKARFIPDRGFDPELDVQLVTSVAEATQRRLPTNPQSSEISDTVNTSLGSVQTVRVQAKVLGPASQLADRLELTSTPARSEPEIIALLGGSFVDTFGRGDSTLGLANLAGSALLGNVGNFIGDTLRLSEFRLFPTIITNDERRTSSLGLAAEAGIDITHNLSISVLKELTTDQPAQYNLRYRINDNILLRGGTDFSGDSRAVIEYERRF